MQMCTRKGMAQAKWAYMIRGLQPQYLRRCSIKCSRKIHSSACSSTNIIDAVPEGGGPRLGKRLGKREVALHIGYVGTGYKGLQFQKTAPDNTIESLLEDAIYKAGGILESNRGEPKKLKMTRSSRTDKNVHSISTVIGMRYECKADTFKTDPEGIELVQAINANLPPEKKVRCFSVQKVPSSFHARTSCLERTYNYFLPISIFAKNEVKGLELLSDAWKLYEGAHPFHCYTKRRLYRKPSTKSGTSTSVSVSIEDTDNDTSSNDLEGLLSEQDDDEVKVTLRGRVHLDWKGTPDEADLIGARHFRRMRELGCSVTPRLLTADGVPCVKLTVTGASFMQHQIRHMVGAAVAVGRGNLPLELLQATLSVPARVSLPLAPAATLLLVDATFMPFRKSWDGTPAMATESSGECLELRTQGMAARDDFFHSTVQPEISKLLTIPEWMEWESDLDRQWFQEGELKELLGKHRQWRDTKPVKATT